jgi:hypothetical protein
MGLSNRLLTDAQLKEAEAAWQVGDRGTWEQVLDAATMREEAEREQQAAHDRMCAASREAQPEATNAYEAAVRRTEDAAHNWRVRFHDAKQMRETLGAYLEAELTKSAE